MTSRALRLSLIPLMLATLVACNTVQGVGEDVQAGGKALERSSEKVQADLKK